MLRNCWASRAIVQAESYRWTMLRRPQAMQRHVRVLHHVPSIPGRVMTVKNRIRSIVAVVLLISAFLVFSPIGSPKQEHSGAETPPASADDTIELYGKPATTSIAETDRANVQSSPNDSQFFGNQSIDNQFFETPRRKITGARLGISQQDSSFSSLHSRSVSLRTDNLLPIESPVFLNDKFEDLDTIQHIIRPGETLQSISVKYFGHPNQYLDIYELNQEKLGRPSIYHKGSRSTYRCSGTECSAACPFMGNSI